MIINIQVNITPKKSIIDPQSQTISATLTTLGFNNIKKITYGRVINLQIESDSEELAIKIVNDMCNKILVNTLIEDYTVNMI
jgi:phosphoribosylformylglycinamidine synthase subunit PurS